MGKHEFVIRRYLVGCHVECVLWIYDIFRGFLTVTNVLKQWGDAEDINAAKLLYREISSNCMTYVIPADVTKCLVQISE